MGEFPVAVAVAAAAAITISVFWTITDALVSPFT